MQTKIAILAILLTGLSLAACQQETPPAAQPEKPAMQTPQPGIEPSRQMTEQAAQEMKQTEQEVKQVVPEVKQELAKEETTVKKEAVAAVDQLKTVAGNAAKEVEAVVADAKPAGAVTGPAEVAYPASMGTVTFNHAVHASRLACGKCHPTDPPVKIAVNKEVAHNLLCKVCHQASGGAAPTACNGCHKK